MGLETALFRPATIGRVGVVFEERARDLSRAVAEAAVIAIASFWACIRAARKQLEKHLGRSVQTRVTIKQCPQLGNLIFVQDFDAAKGFLAVLEQAGERVGGDVELAIFCLTSVRMFFKNAGQFLFDVVDGPVKARMCVCGNVNS
jgi:hypothetical protein